MCFVILERPWKSQPLELSNNNRWRYWFLTVRQLYFRYICHYFQNSLDIQLENRQTWVPSTVNIGNLYWNACASFITQAKVVTHKNWNCHLDPFLSNCWILYYCFWSLLYTDLLKITHLITHDQQRIQKKLVWCKYKVWIRSRLQYLHIQHIIQHVIMIIMSDLSSYALILPHNHFVMNPLHHPTAMPDTQLHQIMANQTLPLSSISVSQMQVVCNKSLYLCQKIC